LEKQLNAVIDYEGIDLKQLHSVCMERVAETISALYIEREQRNGRATDDAALAALQPHVTASLHRVLAGPIGTQPSWLKDLGHALMIEARTVFATNGAAPRSGGGDDT
jgi:hypothetical protein